MSATIPTPRRHPPTLLQAYAGGRHRSVEGWLFPTDISVIAALGEIQTRAGITGAVGEIGVHHGRLAILLYLMLHEGERGWCVDIFEQQHLNVDHSGRGDSRVFEKNLAKHGVRPEEIEIIAASSDTVRADDLIRAVGKTRLMSIDGGHTAEATLGDLRLGHAILDERGAIILDDVFNKDWPGVVDGLMQFLAQPDHDLRPFAISTNKVFLCRGAHAEFYRDALEETETLRRQRVKSSTFGGHEVTIFGRDHALAGPVPIAKRIERLRSVQILRWYMSRIARLGEASRS